MFFRPSGASVSHDIAVYFAGHRNGGRLEALPRPPRAA